MQNETEILNQLEKQLLLAKQDEVHHRKSMERCQEEIELLNGEILRKRRKDSFLFKQPLTTRKPLQDHNNG